MQTPTILGRTDWAHVRVRVSHPCLTEWGNVIAETLRDARLTDVQIVQELQPHEPAGAPHTLFILFQCHHSTAVQQLCKTNCVVVQTEQHCCTFMRTHFGAYVQTLQSAGAVWDYSTSNLRWFESAFGHVYKKVPFCWHGRVMRVPPWPPQRDIDVLFVGAVNDRRKSLLDQCDYMLDKPVYRVGGAFGPDLAALLVRAKIVVNIHFYGVETPLETARLVPCALAGCVIVSEKSDSEVENAEWAPVARLTTFKKLACVCAQALRTYDPAQARATCDAVRAKFSPATLLTSMCDDE